MFSTKLVLHGTLVATAALFVGIACSNSPSCPTPGGPVTGATNLRCTDDAGAPIVQTTSQASCHPPIPDGGVAPTNYGETIFNADGDDDDCKYHLHYSVTTVCENQDVTFTVVATNKSDGSPVTGAALDAELFLNPTHPAPTPFVQSVEGPPGTYVTKPGRFDQAGQWTVRFHLFEACSDLLDDSPHGHAAFYLNVP